MAMAMMQEQPMECGEERQGHCNEIDEAELLEDNIFLSKEQIRQLKLLLRTMCLISRDMPVPESHIKALAKLRDQCYNDKSKGFVSEFEEAVEQIRLGSSMELKNLEASRMETKFKNRVQELESKEELHPVAAIELNTLKMLELQRKVRAELAGELQLKQTCNRPDTQLLDWGLMRMRYHIVSFLGGKDGGTYYPATDEQMRKKRDAERQKRLEQEEQARYETKKRKFFMELQNLTREFMMQAQNSLKNRKLRNDSVLAWHVKIKQKISRTERQRLLLLKTDDQETYYKMVQKSKNTRLMTLLSKTDELLARLGNLVQLQKDAEPEDAFKRQKDRVPKNNTAPEEMAVDVSTTETRDLLEGQRRYNSAVHQIEEQVTEQPEMLQGGQLRPYQLEGLQWMLSLYNNNLNGILADEMGLGKTIQTIGLIAYLMENKGLNGPHIIIAPKAVVPNWANEFATWVPGVTCVVYDGRSEERKVLQSMYSAEGSFNVLITHYDLVMRDKHFLKKTRWHYMVVDEGHRLKNSECQLAKILHQNYHIRRRLLLTGTPIQNTLQELWALLNFILPAIFNSSNNFEEWFNAPFVDPSGVTLTEEEQFLIIRRLHQVLRPFLLRRKKSEVEKYLPSKTQKILKCDLSAWQKINYQQIIESGRVGLNGKGRRKSKGLMNTAMQLRKCCNHPYLFLDYDHEPEGDEIVRASGKFELLDRLLPKLHKAGHRVLLFSQMTRLMDILERYLAMRGFMYLRLDGNTKTEDRGRLLNLFNAEDSPYFMFLLSTRAGGLGLNLQTADTVIIFDSDWNPQMDQQAEDRAHRIGQKKEVRVFVLVSVGSIEEEILERAKGKMGIDAKVIQAGLFNTTSTSQERREMLEEIMKRGTAALSGDVPTEREINHLTAGSDEEFKLYEAMDEKRRSNENYRSRLMEEREIPEWVFLKNEEVTTAKHDMPVTGKRKRKDVRYSDSLTDSQWLKSVEEGADVTEITTTVRRTRSRNEPVTPSTPSTRRTTKVTLRVRRTRSEASDSKSSEGESGSEGPASSMEERPEESSQDSRRNNKRKRSSTFPESDEEQEVEEVEEDEEVVEEEEEEEEEEEAPAVDSDEEDGSYEKNTRSSNGRSRRRPRHF